MRVYLLSCRRRALGKADKKKKKNLTGKGKTRRYGRIISWVSPWKEERTDLIIRGGGKETDGKKKRTLGSSLGDSAVSVSDASGAATRGVRRAGESGSVKDERGGTEKGGKFGSDDTARQA